MNQRHTEFFGPDLARGPFGTSRIETTAVAIATALAQLRVPLARGDDDLRAHADFIRELADRLAPDWAALLELDVGLETGNSITTLVRALTGAYSLLEMWLADAPGGGVTATAPTSVTFSTGTILQTITANRHYRVVTPQAGVVTAAVSYAGVQNWYWAVSRQGRVYYSLPLEFT